MIDTKRPIEVDPAVAATMREWFAAGRGVRRWENAEIGSGRPSHIFTPGDRTDQPDWRYTESEIVTESDIVIRETDPIETFRGRFKARYFGPDVADATRRKADRLAAKHGAEWSWTCAGEPGYVTVTIERARIVPFDQQVTA